MQSAERWKEKSGGGPTRNVLFKNVVFNTTLFEK